MSKASMLAKTFHGHLFDALQHPFGLLLGDDLIGESLINRHREGLLHAGAKFLRAGNVLLSHIRHDFGSSLEGG